jgi:hypothetical protein
MDAHELETILKSESILMPYATARREQVWKRNGRFVHYTSAENAISIIQSKFMWMRNAQCMTDYAELVTGHTLLARFFSQEQNRQLFFATLNECYPAMAEETIDLFNQWWKNNIAFRTYITCLSEHDDAEDTHGRLSMWRGFGRAVARAAIVLKLPAPAEADGLRIFLSPVAYFGYERVEEELRAVILNIQRNRDFVCPLGRERFRDSVFRMLVMAAVSLKHEGFAEEREWRLVYFPDLDPSPLILQSIETIDGAPQIICKIPLHDDPTHDVIGIEIPTLVDRVIIGLTTHPLAIHGALVAALNGASVTDAVSRVVMSGIPLRP